MQSPVNLPFPPADLSDWRAQVRKELNDENLADSLRWATPDGFIAEPYYTPESLASLPLAAIQSVQKQVPGWLNTGEIHPADPKTVNEQARDSLARGADALVLAWPPGTPDSTSETAGLSRLLAGIKLSDTPVFFRTDTDPTAFVKALKNVAPYQLKGGLLTEASTATADLTRLTPDSPQFRTVCVNSHVFHNAGATATQELAFTLARLADAYDQLTDDGLTMEQLVPKTMLSVSVGTSYFLEIAKLRALRVLFSRFLSAYDVSSSPLFIHCQTSLFYDATATPYTNLLRATTETMAAVVGGCDALTVHPYDTVFAAPSAFSDRIARNVSVLLREESYFDKVADPSAGSYYIENQTYQLAETAWALFLDVEARGGFAEAFAAGFITAEIDRSWQVKVDAVRNGKVLVGVNKFRFDEEGHGLIERTSHSFSLTDALPSRRLAEEFEKI